MVRNNRNPLLLHVDIILKQKTVIINNIMHIGVDIDSVLADIVRPLIFYHNSKYKTKTRYHDLITHGLSTYWNCSEDETTKRILEFYNTDHFENLKPIYGSKVAIKILRKKHILSAVTARPMIIEHKSIKWLNKHYPNSFSAVYHTNIMLDYYNPKNKKSDYIKKYNINILIDDNLNFATECAEKDIKVLLFNSPWNQSKNLHKNIKRVFSWRQITQIL
ncbi:MAG: hypothetical protein QXG00_05410 [Candidatus Woesearchaeota archaeon]